MKNIILLFLITICLPSIYGQDKCFVWTLSQEELCETIETMKEQYATNKTYPKNEELQILTALSFYPELKTTKIDFKKSIIKKSLIARPKWRTLFKEKEKRKYVILINKDERNPLNPLNSDFDAQVGFYTHELAHIVDYETKTKNELFKCAYNYKVSSKFKSEMEQKTDLIAIEHGAGYLKYRASHYIFYESMVSQAYLDKKKKSYFTPEEILELTLIAEENQNTGQ